MPDIQLNVRAYERREKIFSFHQGTNPREVYHHPTTKKLLQRKKDYRLRLMLRPYAEIIGKVDPKRRGVSEGEIYLDLAGPGRRSNIYGQSEKFTRSGGYVAEVRKIYGSPIDLSDDSQQLINAINPRHFEYRLAGSNKWIRVDEKNSIPFLETFRKNEMTRSKGWL